MPSTYAHYRFGTQVLGSLPADVRRPIQRFRRLYDVGLHGPDLFLYDNPLMRSTVAALSTKYHGQTGREYFTRICKRLKLEPTEAGLAYLYGALAHYCLDAVCHPFVLSHSGDGFVTHTELETEFDRYLLALDGKEPPHTYDSSPHLKLTRGECVTVSEFYPPATPDNVYHCIRSMAWWVKNLAVPEGAKRSAIKKILSLGDPSLKGLLMTTRPNHSCAGLDEELEQLYNQALELYPRLVEQLMAHMTYNALLGDDFAATFDGIASKPPVDA